MVRINIRDNILGLFIMSKQCLQCPNIIPDKNKFCSKSCAASYNNKGRQRSFESRLKTANKLTGKRKFSIYDWDWTSIQQYYDEGFSTRDCYKKFEFSYNIEKEARNNGLFRTRPPQKFDLQAALVENSTSMRGQVKKYLIKDGVLKNECSNCGQPPIWDDKPLVLVLDHENGINDDNRIENLRLLCPNCNSQTETFCKGNKENNKRKSSVKTHQLINAIRNTETIKDALLSLGMEPSGNNYARITRLAA